MNWQLVIIPALVGLASFLGSLVANRTDIRWLRERMQANERAVNHVANRLNSHIEKHH